MESYRLSNHAEIARLGIPDPDMDRAEYFNQREDYCDSMQGEWFADHPEPLADGSRVIFGGSFGNDHSPGCDHYTWAEVYGPDELDDYNARLAYLEALPECLESDEDETDDMDEEEDNESEDGPDWQSVGTDHD